MGSRDVKFFEVPGSRFGGVVTRADSVTATPPAESPNREILDPIQSALANMIGNLPDPKDKQRAGDLIFARMTLNKECREFIAAQAALAHERLVELHEKSKCACLEQQKIIWALKVQIGELEQDANRKSNDVTRRMADLNGAEQARRELSRFASRTEITKADAAIVTARRKFEEAQNIAAPVQQQINQLTFVELLRENEALARLSAEELRLRAAVTGEEFVDEEFGLTVPARR